MPKKESNLKLSVGEPVAITSKMASFAVCSAVETLHRFRVVDGQFLDDPANRLHVIHCADELTTKSFFGSSA
jgi:hypothetical protein